MAVIDQEVSERYALYNGDCVEVLADFPDDSIHLSIYSPPFAELYNYSSSERDMSNCATYDEFLSHYEFLVEQMGRIMMPGRCCAVHCMDIKMAGLIRDLPGDIIRLHEKHGFVYHTRFQIWKEPLKAAMRTRALGLTHKQIVKDSTRCHVANPDYVVVMRKRGQNPEPVSHEQGLTRYAGSTPVPIELIRKYKYWDDPKTNKLSHWIWQRYASSVWMDIRMGHLLHKEGAKEKDDEKHVCPLQLDVIDRCTSLWSNPGDKVLTPFMGIGSEVYGAVRCGRRGIGVELKPSYYKQSVRNVRMAIEDRVEDELDLVEMAEADPDLESAFEYDAEEELEE
jgi:DNA modification methylase